MTAAPCKRLLCTFITNHDFLRISEISETNFLNLEKNRDFLDIKKLLKLRISICVYDYNTVGDRMKPLH